MISVRLANGYDLSILVEFQQRMAEETENLKLDRGVLEQGLKAVLADPSKGSYYVAVHEDEIVGCHMITYTWSPQENGTVWWLQSVYVTQSHRKHGVFRAMYDNLKNITEQDPSITGLRLYVDVTNEAAQKAYSAIGMDGGRCKLFEYLKGDGFISTI